ncbi:N-acetylmuramoyl-L-alanine amidase [Roseibium sp. H3510]|uniref:N-acetylmuramoyl-L-alanine amidase n=1 Tax=Roseibium algae TaxID=3123038 RepID=A0ABU8TJM7_9HYPH
MTTRQWRRKAPLFGARITSIFVLLAAICGLGKFAHAAGETVSTQPPIPTILGARVAGDSVRTRFVLDLSQDVDVTLSGLSDPYRLILDLPEVRFELPKEAGHEGRGLVQAWRYGLFAAGKSRIVIDLAEPVSIDKTFVLPSVDDQPARLVIDLVKTTRENFVEFARTSRKKLQEGKVARKGDRLEPKDTSGQRPVIVLDPGHGGIDTGAVGVAGTLEKAVVLDFSSILKRKLEETGLYSVYLTREDDTFIPLGERVQIGHKLDADLFISIHADSVRRGKKLVRGATVYTLSEEASDDLAGEVAEQENNSDIIAGVELHDEPADVTDILIDLARRETRNFSVFFARTLVSELKSAVRLINNPHRSAEFIVLKAHDVPSVLVELGYLSNEYDEKLLVSDEWRERMAVAMVEAINGFFRPRFAQENSKAAQ